MNRIQSIIINTLVALGGTANWASAQESITAGPFPGGNYQWRIDADPARPGYQIARRVTANSFTVNVVLANVPASVTVRELIFDIYYESQYLAFAGAMCVNPPWCNVSFSPNGVFPPYVRIGTGVPVCQGFSGDVVAATLTFNVISPIAGVTGLDVLNSMVIQGSPTNQAPCGNVLAMPADNGVAKAVIVIDPNGMNNLSALTVNVPSNNTSLNPNLGNPDCSPTLGKASVSLRSAIQVANAIPGFNRITFFTMGPATIVNPLLPQINDPAGVHIDGTTQPLPGVEISGPAAPAMGFDIVGGNNIIEALTINTFTGMVNAGVRIAGNNNVVKSCNIGTNPATNAVKPNDNGIVITSGMNNQIGGLGASDGNVISGNNNDGIQLNGGTTTVIGNKIGTNWAGGGVLPNRAHGVFINGCANNTIGGVAANAMNVISGNLPGVGLEIAGFASTGNVVQGNRIGTDAGGMLPLPNALAGVYLNGAANNTIGGLNPAAGNLISGNGNGAAPADGVSISNGSFGNQLLNNLIGTDLTGMATLSVHSNTREGVAVDTSAHDNFIGGINGGNVISGNARNGVHITGPGTNSNAVRCNRIGTNAAGAAAVPNGNSGVRISNDAQSNEIGGVLAAMQNIISGNILDGIRIAGGGAGAEFNNRIQNNRIGVGFGVAAIPNGIDGVSILSGFSNVVTTNHIEGNNRFGVQIAGGGVDINEILANFIGSVMAPNGSDGVNISLGARGNQITNNTIGNNMENGVMIIAADSNFITGNSILGNTRSGISIDGGAATTMIGGSSPAASNAITGNLEHGIEILDAESTTIRGNTIQANSLGGVQVVAGVNNAIRANSIFSNQNAANLPALGIDLTADGVVTANDIGDSDTGPNTMQNFPVLTSAMTSAGGLTIAGLLDSAPSTSYEIEFFANDACDPSGNGEGQSFLGSATVTTNPSGIASFSVAVGAPPVGAAFITATATDGGLPYLPDDGNTSEFSECVAITAGGLPPCLADIAPPGGNGWVNVDDLLVVIQSWGMCPGCPADIDGNGYVNVDDLLIVIHAWGQCP